MSLPSFNLKKLNTQRRKSGTVIYSTSADLCVEPWHIDGFAEQGSSIDTNPGTALTAVLKSAIVLPPAALITQKPKDSLTSYLPVQWKCLSSVLWYGARSAFWVKITDSQSSDLHSAPQGLAWAAVGRRGEPQFGKGLTTLPFGAALSFPAL